MTRRFSTLVFDLDGTLTDPSKGIVTCINFALESTGHRRIEPRRIAAEIGPPLDLTLRKLVPGVSEKVLASMIDAYRERYSDIGYSENTVFPEIPGTLARLAAQGARMGVCTSKRMDFAQRILDLFDLSEYFSFVDGGDIGITKSEQLAGLVSDTVIDTDAVMIGDRNVDIEAARANGLRSIGVLWGFGDRAELTAAGATHIVSDSQGLLDVLNATGVA